MNVIKGHGTNEIQSKFLIIANPISSTSLFRVGENFHPLQRSKNIWMQIKALFSRNKTARFMINCVTPIDPWLKEWNNERRNRWANSSEVARSRQLAMFKEKERDREREKRFGRNFVTRRFKQKFLWLETRWPGRVYDN